MSNRPASLIEMDTIISTADPDWNDALDIPNIMPADFRNGGTLCDRCQRFDIQSFARSASRRCGYDLRDVEVAAANGCEFCVLLLDSVKDIEKPTYFTSIPIWGRAKPTNPDLYLHMTVSENYAKKKPLPVSPGLRVNRLLTEIGDRFNEVRNASEHELCLAADPASPAAANDDVTGRYLGHNPASEEHYAAVRSWIKECSAHEKCNQTVSGSTRIDARQAPLPARCIEISRGVKRIHLRRTEGTRGAYITLTHRWNQETEVSKTTTDNYEERLEGRGFGNLPQLFQDVFTISEKLGVRYVWIDSICILQCGDGGADWRREALNMAQYYQFSLFTIAGTMSNMENGLLNPYLDDLTPWASRLVQLPYRDKTNIQAGFFYVYRRKARLMDDYWALVRSSTLFSRGWILQEWLLSTRFLWYTPKGLFFECRTNSPRTDCQERIEFEAAKANVQSHLQLKASFNYTNMSILDFWYQVLEIYSACDLTDPDQDRVLAVAGLAKEVRQILANSKPEDATEVGVQNEMYVSGLWLNDIHHGLLWEEHHSSQPWKIRVNNVPSWSWASLMSQVRWPKRNQGMQEAFRVMGFCLRRQNTHERPEYVVIAKQVHRLLHNTSPETIPGGLQMVLFDPTNMFSCLHIRGKLHTVHVRGYLETEEKLHTAAFSTAYGTSPTSCQWRAICSPGRPEIIAGWGSLEQLRRDDTSCADFGVAVHALHVSTRYLRSGLLIQQADPVLDVLFLEEIEGGNHVYRRLGIGRIADRYLIREFCKSEDQAIQLI